MKTEPPRQLPHALDGVNSERWGGRKLSSNSGTMPSGRSLRCTPWWNVASSAITTIRRLLFRQARRKERKKVPHVGALDRSASR